MRKFLLGLAMAASYVLAGQVLAQGFTTLSEQAHLQASKDKIEVTAVFSYTCPYCYNLEPFLQSWQQQLPDDVEFFHLPAAFNKQWEHLGRAYYIMDTLDITDKAHLAMFDAIHQQNLNLGNMKSLGAFFARYGVEQAQFEQLYSSFGVESRVRQDTSRLRAYKITGVPAVVVDGRFIVTGETAGGLENITKVVDQLINDIRNKKR